MKNKKVAILFFGLTRTLGKTINSIKLAPNGFQKFHNETRQVPLDVFPFVLIYRVFENSIIIFSVFKTLQHHWNKWSSIKGRST